MLVNINNITVSFLLKKSRDLQNRNTLAIYHCLKLLDICKGSIHEF